MEVRPYGLAVLGPYFSVSPAKLFNIYYFRIFMNQYFMDPKKILLFSVFLFLSSTATAGNAKYLFVCAPDKYMGKTGHSSTAFYSGDCQDNNVLPCEIFTINLESLSKIEGGYRFIKNLSMNNEDITWEVLIHDNREFTTTMNFNGGAAAGNDWNNTRGKCQLKPIKR